MFPCICHKFNFCRRCVCTIAGNFCLPSCKCYIQGPCRNNPPRLVAILEEGVNVPIALVPVALPKIGIPFPGNMVDLDEMRLDKIIRSRTYIRKQPFDGKFPWKKQMTQVSLHKCCCNHITFKCTRT